MFALAACLLLLLSLPVAGQGEAHHMALTGKIQGVGPRGLMVAGVGGGKRFRLDDQSVVVRATPVAARTLAPGMHVTFRSEGNRLTNMVAMASPLPRDVAAGMKAGGVQMGILKAVQASRVQIQEGTAPAAWFETGPTTQILKDVAASQKDLVATARVLVAYSWWEEGKLLARYVRIVP